MSSREILTENHNLISAIRFRIKSFLLINNRGVKNIFSGIKKFSDQQQLNAENVIAVSESDLWNKDDNPQNWILTAGKIENLRIAVKAFNGIEIPANEIFSFWKCIGNPNFGKGYVIGREIREGCIVPTIAGGLCQLSNAFYDAALKAGFDIIERYRHSKIIKGSLAEKDRDATVKWNYIDLRFKSNDAFRIEAELTTDKLIVRFRGKTKNISEKENIIANLRSSKLNDCYSCGNFECFKHPEKLFEKKEKTVTTFILDERWKEYNEYVKSVSTDEDYFILPVYKNHLLKTERYNWTIKNTSKIKTVFTGALKRALLLRIFSKSKKNIFSLMLQTDEMLAKAIAKKILLESTHLVVSQNLLPFLWKEGVFGGRTFDVLMTRLPIEKLHERLDFAHSKFPESKTLNDFRASQSLIDLENTALTKSRHIITAHNEIASLFLNKVIKTDWIYPEQKERKTADNNKILFPASALGRKGAYEIRRLALELNLTVVVMGKKTEDENFWKGITVESAEEDPFREISMVVYPVYIEQYPKLLLKAIASGIPVVTTVASGISPAENVKVIAIGDYGELKKAVEELRRKS